MNEGRKSGAVTLLLGLVVAAALVFTVIGGSSALAVRNTAGHGGHKGGGSTPPPSSATLTVSPNPIPFGTSSLMVTGSGFAASSTIYIDMSPDLALHTITTDGSGSFSMPYRNYTWNIAGFDAAYARAYTNASALGTPLASTWITVCSTNPC